MPIFADNETLSLAEISTPLGPFFLAAADHGLRWARFEDPRDALPSISDPVPSDRFLINPEQPHLALARAQLRAYFQGNLLVFNLPIDPLGSEFELAVWKRSLLIKPGSTLSYGQLAKELEAPGAARAVGSALGRNPICVIIPCHRVIGADGSLSGYAGGSERKKALLGLEGCSGPFKP